MGEVTENIHTFALPNESQPYTFKMKYRYNSWKICASRMKRKLVFYSEAQPNLRVANRVQSEIKENILVVLNQYAAGAQASPHSEDECYWYHPDHLGSASWVTDTNGAAYQHLQYMPWGEPLLDQRKSGYTYNTRYTFSGKERDEETGYSYFGARHYNSDLSIWLSVDPLADKYPGLSPYTYCADNPVRLVDPDGRKIDPWNEEGEKALQEYFGQFKPRTIEKAFGLTKYTKKATTPYEADYIEYASNIRSQSKEEFIANMGRDAKRLSEEDLEGAYSVYLALSSEDAYVVGVWSNQLGASISSSETTGGTIVRKKEGYRSHGLMKSNTDFCEDIETNNYIKFHPSRNTPTSKNYFSYEFNFYYNFEWPKYCDIRGFFLFDLDENWPINIGKAFNVTNNKVDIGL